MGLIRKALSVSSLGGVKYTSKREAQTKQALAETKLVNAQRRQLEQGEAEAAAIEHVDAYLRGEYPKWKLTVRERVLLRQAEQENN